MAYSKHRVLKFKLRAGGHVTITCLYVAAQPTWLSESNMALHGRLVSLCRRLSDFYKSSTNVLTTSASEYILY